MAILVENHAPFNNTLRRSGYLQTELCFHFAHCALAIAMLFALSLPLRAQTMVIKPQFDDAGLFHEGLAPVRVGTLWGFIDTRGKFIIAPRSEKVLSGSGGRFGVKDKGLWGFIKTNGQLAIPARYEEVKPFSDGVAAFKAGGKWGYIGPNGVIDTDPRFLYAGQRYEGRQFIDGGGNIGFALGNAWGQWEWRSDKVQPSQATDFNDGYAVVTSLSDNKRHLCNVEGVESEAGFAEIGTFSEGTAPASSDGKLWGFINSDGTYVIKPQFLKAKSFRSGFAPVLIGEQWGYINRQGRIIVKPQFDNAFAPREGFALIRQKNFRGFLEVQGDTLMPSIQPQFSDAYGFQENFAPVMSDGKWGYLGLDGGVAPTERDIVDLGAPAKFPPLEEYQQ
ncbi:WG repeat protein [Rhizobium sp. PP-CC-2G-626]|nr:WG repeat protein [Rhizobium sp. PP-CC-2G-626]